MNKNILRPIIRGVIIITPKSILKIIINISVKYVKKLPKYDLIIDCCAEAAVEASKTEIDKVFYTNLVGTFNILKKCAKDKYSS